MIEAGRRRSGGMAANLFWHADAAENISLAGTYALITAGASLHWMDKEQVLHRAATVLCPDAMFAIVDQSYDSLPWQDAINEVIARHSRNPRYDPGFSLPDELERQELLDVRGFAKTSPVEFRQPTAEYIEQFHSTASLARELMSLDEARQFDDEARDVVKGYQNAEGDLILRTVATVVWGRPP